MVADRCPCAALLRCALCAVVVCRAADSISHVTSYGRNLLAKEEPLFSELTLIAIDAAKAAGDLLRHGFGTHFKIDSKEGHHNLVTEYDYKAEKEIIQRIQKEVPHSQFLAEESGLSGQGQSEDDSIRWVIDPLDGTVNFAHQIPIFAVSIGQVDAHEV